MMLRGDEQFPVVAVALLKERLSVTDEIAQNVFFQVRFGVGGIRSAESIQTCEQAKSRLGDSAVDRVIPATTAGRVRLERCSPVDQLAQAANLDLVEQAHALCGQPRPRGSFSNGGLPYRL